MLPTLAVSLEKLIDSSLDAFCCFDAAGRFLRVNAAVKRLWGYSPEELVGQPYMDFILPDDRERTAQVTREIVGGKDITNFINHYRCKDGTVKPILWSARWDVADQLMYSVAKDATQIVEAEAQRALQEKRMQRAYGLAEIGWWELDLTTEVFVSSDEVFRIYGRPVTPGNQTSTAEFLSFVHPDDVEQVQRDLAQLHGEEYSNYQCRIIRPSGEVVFLNNYFEVVRNSAGKAVALSGITKNVTKAVLNHQALVASKEELRQYSDRLSGILETLGDGFFAVDEQWNLTYWNKKLEEISGVKREAVLGRSLWQSFPADAAHPLYEHCRRALAARVAVSTEDFYPSLNACLEANIYVSEHELFVYLKDITQRKQQEKRLAFMAKATVEVIWERSCTNDDADVNAAKFQEVFGYALPDNRLSRAFWFACIHPDDAAHVLRVHDNAFRSGVENYIQEYRFRKADGDWAYVKDRTYIVRNEAGQPVSLLGAMEDVTQQCLAAIAVRQSEQSYRQLFDSAPLPMHISDVETLQYLDVNRAAVEQLGYARDEFLQMTLWDLRPPEERERVRRHIANLENGQQNPTEQFVYLRKDGSIMLAEISAATIFYRGKKAFLATLKDVTETVRLQKQLMEEKISQQKAVTVATIEAQEKERTEIGKELHDNVNQILATAKLYIENTRYQPDLHDYFVDKGADLVQRAINEIRRLSRALVTPTVDEIDFRDVLLELINYYKAVHLFRIEHSFAFEEGNVDKGVQLTVYRILQEAFNNTIKYAGASEVKLVIRGSTDTLKLAYADNGVGFDPATVKRGLGLNNIQNRADVYKGRVVVKAAPGKGCRISIVFPMQNTKESKG